MENLHVKFEGDNSTYTLLQGKALEQKPPVVINLTGDITTVSNFLKIRKKTGVSLQTIDVARAVVIANKKELRITLFLDPENFYGPHITGRLEDSEELIPFGINQAKYYRKDQLLKLFKFNKLFFDNPEKQEELIFALQKISSTVNISAKDASDDRGNKERGFIKEVSTNIPVNFILNIPIFKGFGPVRFRMEICLDVTEGSVNFWLESTELHEIKQQLIDEIFTEQLKECEGFVIINQ